MAKNRRQRQGFLVRWYRRLRWLRRLAMIAGLAGGVAKVLRGRSGGGSGTASGGPGGSGRPAPVGGPSAPSRSISVTPEPVVDQETVSASAVRTLVAVPPLAGGESADTGSAMSAPLLSVVGGAAEEVDAERTWVDPLEDGGCPPGYPIKANDRSLIYHVPEGRSYNRTAASRCYPSAAAAEADGYRAAKA